MAYKLVTELAKRKSLLLFISYPSTQNFLFPLCIQRAVVLYVGPEELCNFHVGRFQSYGQSRITSLHEKIKRNEREKEIIVTPALLGPLLFPDSVHVSLHAAFSKENNSQYLG